ncbi:hypothetical protein VQ03_13215 [Methylobacterium tarhaniae]|uniref:Uncharacterized protein n=1 Tax=Methylobacterium tarhaniae TaxID=1187852 RepID=A0A0J6VPN2_9HYPH|nr:hypothetical protein VQ03_13215 [Methylobacterium tarhaniae]
MIFMNTFTSLAATAFAQSRIKVLRSLLGLADAIRHDAAGVRSQLPVTMKAGAKRSRGFLNDVLFPADEYTSAQSRPLSTQAPW